MLRWLSYWYDCLCELESPLAQDKQLCDMKQWPFIRDSLLFLGGLAGVLHETVFTAAERPTLLILFAAMLGLPAFLRPAGSDDKKDDN